MSAQKQQSTNLSAAFQPGSSRPIGAMPSSLMWKEQKLSRKRKTVAV